MASESVTVLKWNEKGVFKYFKFTPAVLEEFTISDNLTHLERKEKKKELGQNNVSGKCKNCNYDSKVQFGNPSNWVRHIQTKHVSLFNEYKKNKAKKRARSPSLFLPRSPNAKIQRQETIEEALQPDTITKKKETAEKRKDAEKKLDVEKQERINKLLLDFIVSEALPLRTVESESFRNLIREIDPRVEIFCVKTLKKLLVEEFGKFKAEIQLKFENVESVCLTADIWGVKSRSFLGVTAHWVEKIGTDEKSHVFLRKSAAIAIKRFAGMSPFLFF